MVTWLNERIFERMLENHSIKKQKFPSLIPNLVLRMSKLLPIQDFAGNIKLAKFVLIHQGSLVKRTGLDLIELPNPFHGCVVLPVVLSKSAIAQR